MIMKIEKNKIVFAAVLAVVVIFLISYSILVMGNDENEHTNLKETSVPALEEDQKEYDSKLDALNDLKEVRETNAPSIYDERLLDSTGVYDPDLLDKKKMQMVDSIYQQGQIRYSDRTFENINPRYYPPKPPVKKEKELVLKATLFFQFRTSV